MVVERMLKHYRLCGMTLCAALVMLCISPARGALLPPGATLFPAPGEADPAPGAVQVITTGPVAFASPGAYSGTLTSTVFTNDANNPFGLDRLTFVHLLTNDAGSVSTLARLTMDSYTGFSVDASYDINSAGVVPSRIDRLLAHAIGFSFDATGAGPLTPGSASRLLVLQTDASFFGATAASVINGTIVTGIPALGPIPEPASLGVVALAGLYLLRRRH